MNIIVAGGRDFTDYNLMKDRLDFYFKDIKPAIMYLILSPILFIKRQFHTSITLHHSVQNHDHHAL